MDTKMFEGARTMRPRQCKTFSKRVVDPDDSKTTPIHKKQTPSVDNSTPDWKRTTNEHRNYHHSASKHTLCSETTSSLFRDARQIRQLHSQDQCSAIVECLSYINKCSKRLLAADKWLPSSNFASNNKPSTRTAHIWQHGHPDVRRWQEERDQDTSKYLQDALFRPLTLSDTLLDRCKSHPWNDPGMARSPKSIQSEDASLP